MDLQEFRLQIDRIDDELVRLFEQRMDVSAEIASYKRQHGIPIYDPERERQKLIIMSSKVRQGHEVYISALFSLLFEMIRTEQEKIIKNEEIR